MGKIRHGVTLFLLVLCQLSYGQNADNHEGSEHSKQTGIYEIIISGIYAFDLETDNGAYGSELHFTYWFNHVWGAGLAYTTLFEEDNNNVHSIVMLASYNPTSWLTINSGPSFTLPNEHEDLLVSGFFEAEFNYRLNTWFHFGPLIGVLIGKKKELNVGFQVGFEF